MLHWDGGAASKKTFTVRANRICKVDLQQISPALRLVVPQAQKRSVISANRGTRHPTDGCLVEKRKTEAVQPDEWSGCLKG